MESEPPTNRGDVFIQALCGLVPKNRLVNVLCAETGYVDFVHAT